MFVCPGLAHRTIASQCLRAHGILSSIQMRVIASAAASEHGNVAAAELISSTVEAAAGRPRKILGPPYVIGVCGGTASGKTSVCNKIIEGLMDIPMVGAADTTLTVSKRNTRASPHRNKATYHCHLHFQIRLVRLTTAHHSLDGIRHHSCTTNGC